jgi:hypothetical protein
MGQGCDKGTGETTEKHFINNVKFSTNYYKIVSKNPFV